MAKLPAVFLKLGAPGLTLLLPFLIFGCAKQARIESESRESIADRNGVPEGLEGRPAVPLTPIPDMWAGVDHPLLWLVPPDRRDIQLRALRDAGIRVVRIVLDNRDRDLWWEHPPRAVSIEKPVGQFHWEALEGVDRLMAACRDHDIRLLISFGGLDIHSGAFGESGMFEKREAHEAYTRRVRALLTHYNQWLGHYWHECNDVVYAWEIGGGAGIHLERTGLDNEGKIVLFRSWLSQIGRFCRRIDPDTPVSIGGGIRTWETFEAPTGGLAELGRIPSVGLYGLPIAQDVPAAATGVSRPRGRYPFSVDGAEIRERIRGARDTAARMRMAVILRRFGAGRPADLDSAVLYLRTLIQIAEEEGVPWLVHRFGDAYDSGAEVIRPNDTLWREVIAPAGRRLRDRREGAGLTPGPAQPGR